MAERLSLLDVIRRNSADSVIGLIDEAAHDVPELSNINSARTIEGTGFDSRVRIDLPTASFRHANEGVAATKGRYENRRVNTYLLDSRFETDVAVAERSEDGPQAMIAESALDHMTAHMQNLAKVFYYGTDQDAKGFPGLTQMVHEDLTVDAGGTTAETATSVWLAKWDMRHLRWLVGRGGAFAAKPTRIETVKDANGNPFDAYIGGVMGHIGLQGVALGSFLRIRDITEDAGKGLDDALLGKALAKWRASILTTGMPDVMYATPRSVEQLRASRTATTTTGKEAEMPESYQGVPIVQTNHIRNNEALSS